MSLLFNVEQDIAAPQDRVFKALTDYEKWPEWMPNLVKIEPLNGPEMRAGFQWRETRKFFGRPAIETFEVRLFEPNSAFAVVCDGTKGTLRQGQFDIRYDLVPKGGITHLGVMAEVTGLTGWGGWMFWLFGGAFKRGLEGDVSAMRRHLQRVRF